MKIKLCGDGCLAEDVQKYLTVGKTYDIVGKVNVSEELFDIIADDGKTSVVAIFKDGSKCHYLTDSKGNLWWELVE